MTQINSPHDQRSSLLLASQVNEPPRPPEPSAAAFAQVHILRILADAVVNSFDVRGVEQSSAVPGTDNRETTDALSSRAQSYASCPFWRTSLGAAHLFAHFFRVNAAGNQLRIKFLTPLRI